MQQSLQAKLFTSIVSAAGAVTLGYSIYRVIDEPVHLDWMFLLLLVLVMTLRADVAIPGTKSRITLTDTFIYIGALLLGPWAAAILASVDGLARSPRNAKRKIATVGINIAAMNLAALGASLLAISLFGPLDRLVYDHSLLDRFALALAVIALASYLINTTIVAVAVALWRGYSAKKLWVENYLWTSGAFFTGMLAAGLISKAITVFGFYAFVISIPILLLTYITYRTFLGRVEKSHEHIETLTKLHLATIESLTTAIDARDPLTRGHIQRVRRLAEGLARAIGYPEDQMEGLKAGALLHDIGKLAVPEYILSKPGRLSEAEFARVMIHPVVGADILSSIEFPYEVVPIVKHHHEKYDGSGYPSGLVGEDIPLGARIVTVVDYYDALTTSRPYRSHYTREQALELMRREAGRTFDPGILETFFNAIGELEEHIPAPDLQALPAIERGDADAGRLMEYGLGQAPKTRTEKALRDIATAQREAYSLYEISQTLGSTLKLSEVLAIVATKLENVANFTTLVIYLTEEKRLRVAYAMGRNAASLKGLEMEMRGDGNGWVARHRQVLIGGNPMADLEAHLGGEAGDYHSSAIFPLLRGEILIGTLALYSEENRGYSSDEVRLLETISHHAAVAIDNALAFERTQESALTDNLTGLPNSRYLYSFFDQERSRAERHGYPLAMMMMDLDGFKRVNDTYGHSVGDEMLRQVSKVARAELRSGDTLIRYAGDEFVAVLHRATPDVVIELKMRMQEAIDDIAHEVRPGRIARVGVSIGYASYGQDGCSIDDLMEVADQRMYEDKLARRRGPSTLRVASA